MAYTKNTWVDQDVERPKTYEVTNNQDGSITLTDSFGLVTELGTPVNAVNMNHIEDGIDGCAIRKHNLTETFALGEWVLGGSGDDGGIYKSLIANNVGNAITDDTKWGKVELGGSSRNIGEIVPSTLPLTDAGLHLLDGALLQYGSYKEFIDYIADLYAANPSANYFTTESLWQQSVTQYGVCGKFVYDSVNNTVRLPKVSGKLDGTTDINALGDLEPLFVRLPNITGNFGMNGNSSANGAFEASGANGSRVGGSNAGDVNVNFSAARSSSVYSGDGSNTAIHEQAIKMFVYIVIATSSKTDIQVDIDEIATDLNGKADVDLSNVNDQAKILMGGMGMPSDTYVDLTFGATGSQYTAPADGWFAAIGYSNTADSRTIELNNQTKKIISSDFNNAGWAISCLIPVSKGDIIYLYYTAIQPFTSTQLRFIYAQGSESEAN